MSLSVFKRILVLFILASSIGVGAYGWYLHQAFNRPFSSIENLPESFDVKAGDGLYRVCRQMESLSLVENGKVFCRIAMWSGVKRVIKGRYQILAEDTPITFLTKIKNGDVMNFSISLIEGHNFKQMLQRIQTNPNVNSIFLGLEASEIMKRLTGDETLHPEGQFYPDTYVFTYGVSDKEILVRAHQRLKSVLDEEWSVRTKNLPYKSPYEALIMASIVEKETAVGAERPQIAKVFVDRLNLGMRLQTDPTVIYGMGDRYKGNITRKDLRQKTPYNTYKIDGLPPTPIAMVGRAAIHAALHPEGEKALYFVAKGDGTHYFSKTLAEHNRAVRKYQMKRVKSYRSTPKK
jgi:UPF0755 protein